MNYKNILVGSAILAGLSFSMSNVQADNTLTSNEHTQLAHLNTEQGWSNDVQNIVWNETGKYYDVYFLHSKDGADNPFGEQGQDWYHTTTTDFVHYTKQNSAISAKGPDGKYTWKSAWTGSVVINKGNITGVPKGAKVAYFSGLEKNDGGSQNIWAAWSSDNGKTFSHVLNNASPVIDHSWSWTSANKADERDSSVFYLNGELYMYTSEGEEIGVYKSKDGLNWTKADQKGDSKVKPYTFFKGHSWDGNAPIECPAVRTMQMPNGKTKQVLFFGAKDASKGETTGTYYIVGHLDSNKLFAAETNAKRIDQGSDFYGANESAAGVYNLTFNQVNKDYFGRIYIVIWQGKNKISINYDPSTGGYVVNGYASELDNNMSGQGTSNYYKNGLLGNGNGYYNNSGYLKTKAVQLKIVTDKNSVEILKKITIIIVLI